MRRLEPECVSEAEKKRSSLKNEREVHHRTSRLIMKSEVRLVGLHTTVTRVSSKLELCRMKTNKTLDLRKVVEANMVL